MPSASEWQELYAERLGAAPPDAGTVDLLLGMTGIAAHASERTAAPISAWLVGMAGTDPAVALALAKELAAELAVGDESRAAGALPDAPAGTGSGDALTGAGDGSSD